MEISYISNASDKCDATSANELIAFRPCSYFMLPVIKVQFYFEFDNTNQCDVSHVMLFDLCGTVNLMFPCYRSRLALPSPFLF